jgi:hypothetical protein
VRAYARGQLSPWEAMVTVPIACATWSILWRWYGG